MKKLLTLICLSLIVSASVESKQAKFNQCFFDSEGKRVCCTPFGFCYPAPKPPPADPIISEVD